MSSLQQRIMTQAVDRMKLVNGTGSYVTNLANRVKDSETNWHENQGDLPALSVFDGDVVLPDPQSGDKVTRVIVIQHLLFRGYLKQGTDASAARQLISDIYTAIRVDDRWSETGTPLVMQTRMVKHSVVRNPDNFEIEACEVEIELQYALDKFTS